MADLTQKAFQKFEIPIENQYIGSTKPIKYRNIHAISYQKSHYYTFGYDWRKCPELTVNLTWVENEFEK